jgi:hypothetical protein
MSETGGIVPVTDHNLDAVLGAEHAVLILSKKSCGYCAEYYAEIEALRAQGQLTSVTIGKVTLDQPGAGRFKRDNPWIATLEALPYTLLYLRGERVDQFAASRGAYLRSRAARTFDPDQSQDTPRWRRKVQAA